MHYTRQNPFLASIKKRYRLNKEGYTRQTWHVELDLHDSGIAYEPGDSLAVLAKNDPETVRRIIEQIGASPDERVEGMSLFQFIQTRVNLAKPTKKLLEALQSPHAAEEKAYAALHDVEETLAEHPFPHELSSASFLPLLAPLLPRFYSIASSKKAVGEEVHLLVAYVNYTIEGKERRGICSHYLCDLEAVGEQVVPIYLHPTRDFRLPAPEVPIIMIGPGTGVAPYRAFLQERIAAGASKNWLFFGECHRATDFFYESYWDECMKAGHLQLDCAFSRDQAEKRYVQHVMWERRQDLYKALQEGAHLYVCGDAHHMAKDVEATLLKIIESEGNLTEDAARAYLKEMRIGKRYLRDVY